ncbi:MAG: hypothetical protein D6744_15435 [Planctomycetota bacterium]|nr:MAG: hypothetical protein D6744_15435 [Planctomycetota bacterium]
MFRWSECVAAALFALGLSAALCGQSSGGPAVKRDLPLDAVPSATSSPPTPAAPAVELPDEQHARLEEARRALEDGNLRDALRILTALVQQPPARDDFEANLLLATVAASLEDLDIARHAAEAALRVRPGSADVHVLLGSLARNTNRLDEAIAHFRAATLSAERELNNVNVTWAWYQLGKALDDGGYTRAASEALAHFDRAVFDTHPEHRNAGEVAELLARNPHGAFERRIELLEQLGDADARLSLTEEALARWPGDGFVLRERARALIAAGRPAEAVALCRDALEQPALESALVDVALTAAAAAGQVSEWVESYLPAWRRGERVALGRLTAEHLHRQGHDAEALAVWQAIWSARPTDTEIMWRMARLLRDEGRMDEALDALAQRLRAASPPTHLAQEDVGEWAQTLADRPQLREQLDAWRSDALNDYATEFVTGLSLLVADPAAADQALAAAVEANPDLALASVVRGELLLARGSWAEARRFAEQLLEQQPKSAAAHFVLAQALEALDELESAEDAFRKAVRLDRESVAYRIALARHYQRRGNLVGAQRYYTEALTLDPGDGEALEGLIDSYLRDGKVELARSELKRLANDDVPPDALRRIRTTLDYIDRPYSEAHLAELRKQNREFPDDVKTAKMLATGLVWTQRFDEAGEVLEAARRIAPDDDELVMLQRRVFDARLEFDKSVAALEEILARHPNRVEAQQALAMTYLYDFQLEKAREWFRRLMGSDPGSMEQYRRFLLLSYTEFGEADEAVALIDEWLAETPDDADLFQQKLEALLAADRGSEAFDLVIARLEDASNDPALRNSAWVLATAAGRFKDLEPRLRSWLADAGQDDRAGYTGMLVEGLIADDRPEEALRVASEFDAATWIENIQRRMWLGSCRAAAGEIDKAVAEYDALLDEHTLNEGSRAGVRRQLINALLDAQRYDEALARCEQWLQAAPDDADRRDEIQQYRLAIYTRAGRDEDALAIMEAQLPQRRAEVGFNNDLGYTWVDAGRNVKRAAEMILYAAASEPLNAAYLDSYGWAMYKQGRFEDALKWLSRASRLRAGRDAVILDHLADVQWRLGSGEAAHRTWEQALEMLSDRDAPLSVPEQRLAKRIEAKLAAVKGGAEPQVAPTAEQQQE